MAEPHPDLHFSPVQSRTATVTHPTDTKPRDRTSACTACTRPNPRRTRKTEGSIQAPGVPWLIPRPVTCPDPSGRVGGADRSAGTVARPAFEVARDASGRWRHPARLHRARPELSPTDVPRLTYRRTDGSTARRHRPTRNQLSAPRSPAAAAPPIPPRPFSFTPAKGHGQQPQRGCQQANHPETAWGPARWLYRAVVTSLLDEFGRRPVPRTGGVDEFGRHRVSCQGSIGVLLVKGAGHAADVEGRAVRGDPA